MKIIHCPELDNQEFAPVVERYGELISKALFFKLNESVDEIAIPSVEQADLLFQEARHIKQYSGKLGVGEHPQLYTPIYLPKI